MDYDEFEFSHLKERVQRVLDGGARKISTDSSDWRCRGCFKSGACWEGAEVGKRCQTCQFVRPKPDGGWYCNKHDKDASVLCQDYKLYEPLPKE